MIGTGPSARRAAHHGMAHYLEDVESGVADGRRHDAAAPEVGRPPEGSERARGDGDVLPLRDGPVRTTMLNSMSPSTAPPSRCSNRCRMNARWTSSRSPPAMMTTTPNRRRSRSDVSRSSSGLRGTFLSHGATVRSSKNDHGDDEGAARSARDRAPLRGLDAEPTRTSRARSRCAQEEQDEAYDEQSDPGATT